MLRCTGRFLAISQEPMGAQQPLGDDGVFGSHSGSLDSVDAHIIAALERNIELLSPDATGLDPFSASARGRENSDIGPEEAFGMISCTYEPHLYSFAVFHSAEIGYQFLSAGLVTEPVTNTLEHWLKNPMQIVANQRAFEEAFGSKRSKPAASLLQFMLRDYDTTAAPLPKAIRQQGLSPSIWIPFLRGLAYRGVYSTQLATLAPMALRSIIEDGSRKANGRQEEKLATTEFFAPLQGEMIDRAGTLGELLLATSAEFGSPTLSNLAFDIFRRYQIPVTYSMMKREALARANASRRFDDWLLRTNGQLHIAVEKWVKEYFPQVYKQRVGAVEQLSPSADADLDETNDERAESLADVTAEPTAVIQRPPLSDPSETLTQEEAEADPLTTIILQELNSIGNTSTSPPLSQLAPSPSLITPRQATFFGEAANGGFGRAASIDDGEGHLRTDADNEALPIGQALSIAIQNQTSRDKATHMSFEAEVQLQNEIDAAVMGTSEETYPESSHKKKQKRIKKVASKRRNLRHATEMLRFESPVHLPGVQDFNEYGALRRIRTRARKLKEKKKQN